MSTRRSFSSGGRASEPEFGSPPGVDFEERFPALKEQRSGFPGVTTGDFPPRRGYAWQDVVDNDQWYDYMPPSSNRRRKPSLKSDTVLRLEGELGMFWNLRRILPVFHPNSKMK
jgi:hypothetical protein